MIPYYHLIHSQFVHIFIDAGTMQMPIALFKILALLDGRNTSNFFRIYEKIIGSNIFLVSGKYINIRPDIFQSIYHGTEGIESFNNMSEYNYGKREYLVPTDGFGFGEYGVSSIGKNYISFEDGRSASMIETMGRDLP